MQRKGMHVQKERKKKNKDTTLNWELQSFDSGTEEEEASSSAAHFY